MTPPEPQNEVESLRRELAKRDLRITKHEAALIDRDATIAKLSSDVATLQAVVDRLLSSRRGGLRVAEGQGLLFPENAAGDAPAASSSDADADDEGAGDEEADPP